MMKNILIFGIVLGLGCAYFEPNSLTATESSNNNAVTIYEKGNEYFKQKDYVRAIIEFEKIIDNYPGSEAYEPATYLAAFSYYKLNNFEAAAGLGEKFVKEFPMSSYYLNAASLLGESYFKLAQDYNAAYYLIDFYTQTKDTSAQVLAFDRIITILPELSISQLEKLHRHHMSDPIDEHLLFYLAQIEAREGKKKEAERDLSLLVRRFPNTDYVYEVDEYKKFIGLGEATGRVGILLPLTGSFSQYGQKLLPIIKFFQESKLLPFSLHFYDTKSDPIEATVAALKLIEDIHVDFIIAPVRIYEAFGICGLAVGKGIPVIMPLTSEARFEIMPLIFTGAQSSEEQAKVIARYSMGELGLTKFGILYPDMVKYRTIAEVFAQEILRNNREVVAMVDFSPDSVTIKAELEGMKEKEPQAIFLAMDTDMIINTTPQIAYYGLEDTKILGIESFNNEKVARLGEKYVDGATFVAPTPTDSTILRETKRLGFESDEVTTKVFQTLWQLKELKNYDRTTLPTLIPKILKGKETFCIYQINGYEVVKLAEVGGK